MLHEANIANVKAVIFDWDGTLADSQGSYVSAWRSALSDVNYDASTADLDYVIGRSFPDCLQYFARRTLIDPDEFESHWRQDFDARIRIELTVYPDATECAQALKDRGIPIAIATQTPRTSFERQLSITKLDGLTQVTVCRTDVARPKPAPDLYLEACRRLSANPQDCIAVEDSLVGIKSARDAGLRVLGIARLPGDLPAISDAADWAVLSLNSDYFLQGCGQNE